MALVILKNGKKTDDQKWSGFCRSCHAKAECVRGDIQKIESCPREHYEFAWVKCPECGAGPLSGLLMYPSK